MFPYSRRSGTPAYDFPAQVHEREKQARSREMNALAEEVRREVLAAHVGTEDEVLLETPLSETLFTGYTRLYIPVVVSAPATRAARSFTSGWASTMASASVQHSAKKVR